MKISDNRYIFTRHSIKDLIEMLNEIHNAEGYIIELQKEDYELYYKFWGMIYNWRVKNNVVVE